MNTGETERRLNDYIDGLLSDEERTELEGLLARDPALRQEEAALRALINAAADLPREIDPPRDFWPVLAANIERGVSGHGDQQGARSAWWSQPMIWAAAGLFIMAGGALLALLQSGVAPVLTPGDVFDVLRGNAGSSLISAEFREAEAEFIKARSELRMAVDEQKSRLSPEVLAVVEENLAIIDDAIVEMQTALASNPQDVRLTEQLLAMYQQQVDLLRQAAQLPDAG